MKIINNLLPISAASWQLGCQICLHLLFYEKSKNYRISYLNKEYRIVGKNEAKINGIIFNSDSRLMKAKIKKLTITQQTLKKKIIADLNFLEF